MAAAYYFKPRSSHQSVFILCNVRSGSNLLLSYLNSVPNVFLAGEILNPEQILGLRAGIDSQSTIFRHLRHVMNYRQRTITGAKLPLMHLETRGLSYNDMVNEFPSARWIILYREDVMAQYISLQIANKTGSFKRLLPMVKHRGEQVSIEFNPQNALLFRDSIVKNFETLRECSQVNAGNLLWISYE